MPCPACGCEDAAEWKPDPLRWELDPPCSQAEWDYLMDLPQAPSYMASQSCAYMNSVCRGCYSNRLEVLTRVQQRIRKQGGLEELKPSLRVRREYEAAHAHDLVARRPAKISGLQSVAAVHLNGQCCKLLVRDAQTERWTVELVTGEQKSIKESNLEASKEIDFEYETAKARYFLRQQGASPDRAAAADAKAAPPRPLGERTAWPKVKGVHPGAVVRLQGLVSAPELNGRKGRCLTFDPETGRWKVDLGDEQKSLKPENLTPAPGEKPPTLQSATEEKKELGEKLARLAGMNAREVFAESYGWQG